jgi:hypothetical protein
MENGKLAALLGFLAGLIVGLNWERIKKSFPKIKETTMELFEMAKEKAVETGKAVSDKAMKVMPMAAPAPVAARRGRKAAA